MNPALLQKLSELILSLKTRVKCPICLDHIENIVELECSHRFCKSCLSELKLQTPVCPLCKLQISKRAPTYKDQFVDKLSKFVNNSCQLIKEKYVHEVELLCSTKKKDLRGIIETAPQDVDTVKKILQATDAAQFSDDAFENLIPNPMKRYGNSKKQVDQAGKSKLLNFQNNECRTNIIDWLTDNQEKLDVLTQNSQFLDNEETDFQMPSISQVSSRKPKRTRRLRSQSLNINDKLAAPPVTKHQSLAEGLNQKDDYDIEEVYSETVVKQVERKVLQDMLEDECLANLEHIAQQNKEITKTAPTKEKKKSVQVETNNADTTNSDSSTGWDRIKDVKKTLKKASKEPKKLKINLQSNNSNAKKSPKENKAPGEKVRNKRKAAGNTSKTVKSEQHKLKARIATKEDGNSKTSQAFNLGLAKNPSENLVDKRKESPEKDISPNIENCISVLTAKNTNETKRASKEEVSKIVQIGYEENPVKKTCQSSNQQDAIYRVTPLPANLNDVDSILSSLCENLKGCILSAVNSRNEFSQQLVDCFTNFLTYANKIRQIRNEKVTREIQTSLNSMVARTATFTQTICINTTTTATQTEGSHLKTFSHKHIQTSQNLTNVLTQTDYYGVFIEREIARAEDLATRGPTEEKDAEGIMKKSKNCSKSIDIFVTDKDINKETQPREHIKSKSRNYSDRENHSVSENVLCNKEINISVTESKETNPSTKASKNISQDSVLICSLNGLSTLEKKVNRQLSYGESQNRKFKRIRKPASDSESDGDENPCKRKFIRDDLTVAFMDSDEVAKNDVSEQHSSSESEKIDYDQYLLEVMNKYDSSPTTKKILPVNRDLQITSNNRSQNGKKSQRLKMPSPKQKKREHSQDDAGSGEHVFTANVAFQENLDKFEQEILGFEQSNKAFNTEPDFVENTPLVVSKPKMSGLLEDKQDPTKQRLKIICKGSVSTCNPSKKTDTLTLEYRQEDSVGPATLDRNIKNLPSQTQKCTDGIAGLLEDLQNNDDFFKSAAEFDGNKKCTNIPHTQTISMNIIDNGRTNEVIKQDKKINVTQENVDEFVGNLSDFEDDEDVEKELQKISFTAAQREIKNGDKINILQNLKLKSQSKTGKEIVPDEFLGNTDVSDEEIVETTPQKKNKSINRSLLNDSPEPDICFDIAASHIRLPPPPGFEDDSEPSSPVTILRPRSEKQNERQDKLSLTPDRLSDFIVTPCDKYEHTQKEESLRSSFVTPSRPAKEKSLIPSVSHLVIDDSEGVFSPIAKSSVKITQSKFTPLVSTSRLSAKKPKLMTSTPNQKSILNYVVSSQEDGSMPTQKSKPCVMWSRILNKDLNVFTQLECKKLLTTSKVFSTQVTHLVVLVDEKGQIVSHTAKILQAIAAGIWVVRYEWVEDCLNMNRIVSEEPYEALDTTGVPGPQVARLSRKTNPLFKKFKFYCAPPLKSVSKGDLETILQLSGGEIAKDLGAFLENDNKVRIILTESSFTEETDQFETWLTIYKAVTVDVEWLTSCIGQYKLVSFRPFLVAGDESVVCDLGYPPTLIESVPFTLTEAL